MSRTKKVSYNKLKKECKPDFFKFEDTSKLTFSDDIIGQERAVKAMEFGLNIKSKGYNIFMCGMTGTGKTSYAQNIAKKMAKKSKTPDDWCYVYNFDDSNRPKAINLPAGLGKVFQKDMEEFVKVLKIEIAKAFDSEDYEREKAAIAKEYQAKKAELMEKLNKDAERQGFKVKTTNAGMYFLPVIEGKTITEEEYANLDEEVKHEINEKSNMIQMETLEIIRQIKNIEKEAEERVSEWENKIALFAVGIQINDLKEKYRDYKKVLDYLEKVQEDILKNLDKFRDEELTEEQQLLLPWLKTSDESHTDKYKVNLLVDNSELEGAPVVTDYNPTYYNILGKVEHENEFGTMITDFTMIKSGLFHQANGGYLILQAKDVLNNIQSWEALKRVLRTGEIAIENMKEQMGLIAVSTLKPEPIPVDVKVILVGSEYIYQMLYEYDEEFRKLFKVKVDFDAEMDRNSVNMRKLAQFIGAFCNREKVPHFDRTGVAKVVEYSSRLVEDQTKLSTRFNEIVEILSESVAWAEIEGCSLVTGEHVKKAIQEKIYRSNKYDKKLLELIKEGTIMIDTEGEVIGQINGLTIIDTGDYSFGKPSRITANTFMGERGIVNIEREVEMSGTSHSKGIMILSGYIGQKYAQDMPLSLTASLCFEQLYGAVDGDSASSAELYAVLSSLAEVPIKQSIAVTGSVNQKGEIQPIGGVTEKIEGFFELCKLRGLNGQHGVIIPYQNIKNLVLNDEVIEACKEGKFNIYAVKTIDEGIEILTGKKAGTKNKNGKYPPGTINYLVYEKLKKFSKAASAEKATNK
ncbi:ATP-binding protein [Acetivibrio saccincola]|jgi:lon-related putative ATP-dependent protease|uniref:endopeptidase La n=1 Tax=Acetivibrio saccincola TaxID=1677857 RepID=A0A2K9DYM4_9FIRM|nr:ATP-binding protein [Acetivibrio saccincola]AUG56602.1 Lon protease [Acetivibrio saccincola]NLW27604.1 AAA family ATPase [Acetivibrio saccincola]